MSLSYLSTTAYIVIVIVALAEELLALLILIISSLLVAKVSAIDIAVLLSPKRINPSGRTTSVPKMTGLFTASSPSFIGIIEKSKGRSTAKAFLN